MDIRETKLHPTGWREEGKFLIHKDYDDNETRHPAEFRVCECCGGEGAVVNPSIDSHGLSSQEFDEDPDFREDYLRGAFDISCPHCHGRNVTLFPSLPDGIKAYQESEYEERSYYAEIAAERRMGC